METKIKVVWICHFSNPSIREKLRRGCYLIDLVRKLTGRMPIKDKDYAQWNTNAVNIIKNYKDIDLSIIMPHRAIKGNLQKFDLEGVHYYCFRSQDDSLGGFLLNSCLSRPKYKRNRKIIYNIIKEISPDIVHVIGAENPYYSYAAMDIPHSIPLVLSLQTLMSDEKFLENYTIDIQSYSFRSELERRIIQKCDYLACPVPHFISCIRKNIKSNAVFLNMPLAVGVELEKQGSKKDYDFVYFAADISKACDYAIEAFAIAHSNHPEITMNVSGGYTPEYKSGLDKRLKELGISEKVIFTGSKDTHDQVIEQIKKSRFALLPLKVDLVSGTIREAMACGLPVVTTITPATPDLNKDRESVLLSEKGDFQSMANNMIRLVENQDFSEEIARNAQMTVMEKYGNESAMLLWKKGYHEILNHFKNGTPFSDDMIV